MARISDPNEDFDGILDDIKRAEKILNERIHDLTARHRHKVEIEHHPIQAIGTVDSFRIKVRVFKEIF